MGFRRLKEEIHGLFTIRLEEFCAGLHFRLLQRKEYRYPSGKLTDGKVVFGIVNSGKEPGLRLSNGRYLQRGDPEQWTSWKML